VKNNFESVPNIMVSEPDMVQHKPYYLVDDNKIVTTTVYVRISTTILIINPTGMLIVSARNTSLEYTPAPDNLIITLRF
jgi:hypothetical protein